MKTIKITQNMGTVANGKLHKFKADVLEGDKWHERDLDTWDTKIAELLLVDFECQADIEDKLSKDGKFTNHVITMIYDKDGKPLFEKQKANYQQRDNPESRHSIESQVAVKVITELEIAGKELVPGLKAARDNWLKTVLGINLIKVAEAKGAKVVEELFPEIPDFKSLGEFYTHCQKLWPKKGPSEIKKELGLSIKQEPDVKKLNEALAALKEVWG